MRKGIGNSLLTFVPEGFIFFSMYSIRFSKTQIAMAMSSRVITRMRRSKGRLLNVFIATIL